MVSLATLMSCLVSFISAIYILLKLRRRVIVDTCTVCACDYIEYFNSPVLSMTSV